MTVPQLQLALSILAGSSLFLHLCSASNFIPSSEMWFIGIILSYLHYALNFAARVSLLSVVVMIGLEAYLPNSVTNITRIQANVLPKYMVRLLLTALVCSAVRFILPGPITYYSRFYKLSVLLSLAGSVIAAVDLNSRRSTQKKFDKPTTESQSSLERSASSESTSHIPTKRHRTAMELLQTETSYLRNLNTIITVYKEPLEKAVADGQPLLAVEDIRSIFGGIKEIANLHTRLHHDISEIINNWEEDCCIAEVVMKYQDQLVKAYPPYVNYFDMGKELLLKRQEASTDLQTFFIKCFHDPRSLKQTLDALLIRPVQRLPSLLLLVTDLQKRTPKNLRDHTELDEAKEILRQVLSYINEDKRKTEGKTKIFDIVYEVTNCPIELVSANRLFVGKVDVTTLNDGFYRQGERLALYLLTDMLEIAKWRNRTHGTSLLKHVQLLPLKSIISVFDIDDVDDCGNMFAVRYTNNGRPTYDDNGSGPTEKKVSILQVHDDKTFKSGWLTSLVTQIAHAKDLPNNDGLLTKMKQSDLLNHLKRSSKLYKKLKTKIKTE